MAELVAESGPRSFLPEQSSTYMPRTFAACSQPETLASRGLNVTSPPRTLTVADRLAAASGDGVLLPTTPLARQQPGSARLFGVGACWGVFAHTLGCMVLRRLVEGSDHATVQRSAAHPPSCLQDSPLGKNLPSRTPQTARAGQARGPTLQQRAPANAYRIRPAGAYDAAGRR